MPAAITQHVMTILFAALWWLLVTGIGLLPMRRLAIRYASRGELLFLAFGAGAVLSGYGVFVLGITGSLHAVSLTLLLASLSVLSLAGWWKISAFSLLPPQAPKDTGIFSNRIDMIAGLLIALLLATGLLLTLAPETGRDALIYHLTIPKLYLEHGGIYPVPGNISADYPLLVEMHYLLALFLQNDILAKMMNYLVLLQILYGIGLFTRNIMGPRNFPVLNMLIFLSIPSVFVVSHTAYTDLFVALFTLAAFYCFLRWSDKNLTGWLILLGLFTGAAIACKYTILLIVPLGILGILFFARKNGFSTAQTSHVLMIYIIVLFLAGGPFYLKNWIVTGNPVHPFLFGIFGARGWDAEQARAYDLFVQNFGMGRGLLDYLLLPFNLSFRAKMDSVAFDGVIGPIFFFTLPFLAALPRKTPLLLIIAFTLFSFLFWASSAQEIRFLIPLFPFLAILTGSVMGHYQKRKGIFLLLACLTAGSLAYNFHHLATDFQRISPLRAVIGLESRDHFLDRLIPAYPMYRFVNENLPPGAKVFLIFMNNYIFLCKHDSYSDSIFEAHTIGRILRNASTPEVTDTLIKKEGFTHIMYDRRYLTGSRSTLAEAEKIKFRNYQDRYLSLVTARGPYRLYSLKQ